MITPFNLAENFGDQFQISYDPAVGDVTGMLRDRIDPWMIQISGKYGTIYPYGHDRLAVDVDHHPIIAMRLTVLGCCELVQDGDDEKTFAFDVADFDTVAEIIRPYLRRQLSDEERQKTGERLRNYQFKSRSETQITSPRTPASGSA